MGSIIGHRIDYNGVGVMRGQGHMLVKMNPSSSSTPTFSLKDLEKKKKKIFHFPSLDIKKIEHRQNLDNPRGKKINILPRVPRDVKFRRIRLVHHYL